jgi:hypothetical protein
MSGLTIQDLVREFAMTDADEKLLASVLGGVNQGTFERVAREELSRWGQPFPFTLRNWEVRRALMKDARATAHSIRRTFNRDLRAKARQLRAKNPTQSKGELARSLQEWFGKRQAYKGKSVAITEAYKTQQKALLQFYERSGLTTARFYFGGSLKCPICSLIAQGNPHTFQSAQATPTPIHVNCGDAWTAELDAGQRPAFGQLWTGK